VKRAPCRLTLVTAAGLACAGSLTVSAADWSETLDAGLNTTYNSNPRLVPGPTTADESALLAVDGSLTGQTERGQLSLTPRFSLTRFQRDHDLDINTGSLDFGALEKFERGEWTVAAQALTDSTVTSELGLSGISNVNRRHSSESLSSGFQYYSSERLAWRFQASYALTRYTDAEHFGLTNYAFSSVQLAPAWSFSERLQGEIDLETDHVTPDGGRAEHDYSANLLLKRKLSAQYSWEASFGRTRVDTAGANTASSWVYSASATRQGERVRWELSVKRAVLPIGLGLLARSNQASLNVGAGLSERSSLNVSMSVMRTDPVALDLQLNPILSVHIPVYDGASWAQVSAEWKYVLTRSWSLTAGYLQARARSGSWPEAAIGRQGRLGITWQSERL
jgi:hypothetical protein